MGFEHQGPVARRPCGTSAGCVASSLRHCRTGTSHAAAFRLGLETRGTSLFVENSSFAPSGLVYRFNFFPRLAPWAAFFRRFAAFHPLTMQDRNRIGVRASPAVLLVCL